MTKVNHWQNGRIKWIEVRGEKKDFVFLVLHNSHGPASQSWYGDGQERRREYYVDGKRHREGGPGVQKWYENGQEMYRSYWMNDTLHNTNGPACQEWHKNGQEWRRNYFIDGKELTEAEFKALQDFVEVMYEGRTARISKTQAIELGLID